MREGREGREEGSMRGSMGWFDGTFDERFDGMVDERFDGMVRRNGR